MDSKSLIKFKDILTKELQKIENIEKKTIDNVKEIKPSGDEADEANALLEQHISLKLYDRDRKLKEKINLALQKIEDKSFGQCEECGEAIGIKRLEIRPITKLCVVCQETKEKVEKMYNI